MNKLITILLLNIYALIICQEYEHPLIVPNLKDHLSDIIQEVSSDKNFPPELSNIILEYLELHKFEEVEKSIKITHPNIESDHLKTDNIQFSPDGAMLAICYDTQIRESKNGVIIWDIKQEKEINRLSGFYFYGNGYYNHGPMHIEWAPHEPIIVFMQYHSFGGIGNQLMAWNFLTGELKEMVTQCTNSIHHIQFSWATDGTKIAIAKEPGIIRILDGDNYKEIDLLYFKEWPSISSLAWMPYKNQVIVSLYDTYSSTWIVDLETKEAHLFYRYTAGSGGYILKISGSRDGNIVIYDGESTHVVPFYNKMNRKTYKNVPSTCLSTDRNTTIRIYGLNKFDIYNLKEDKEEQIIQIKNTYIKSIHLSPCDKIIAVASNNIIILYSRTLS